MKIFARKYVIQTTMKHFNLSKKEAGKRVDALLKSGIMEDGSPDDTMTQMLMDNFLRFDLSKLDYLDVFKKTMIFPALVDAYDKNEGQHLAKTLIELKKESYNSADVKKQIELFDKFFCRKIWNRFPGVQQFGNNIYPGA